MSATIVRTGPLTVLKDRGRVGSAAFGVAPSGPVDRAAYLRANRLAGNPDDAAVLECTLGGLRIRLDEPATVVLTGTDAVLTVDGRRTGVEEVVAAPAGAEVGVTVPRRGLRSYLAVRGGFGVPVVLGSRSTDVRLGMARPAAGDVLPIGSVSGRSVRPAAQPQLPSGIVMLAVDLGPRADWFTDEARETFLSAEFTVSPAGDATGLRLDGPVLTRCRSDELPSEGVVRGSVQVPPDGHPIVFQADHPLTGGYPVIAVLTPSAADLAAQARPGSRVRFALAGPV